MKISLLSMSLIMSKKKMNLHITIFPLIIIMILMKMFYSSIQFSNSICNLDNLTMIMMILSILSSSLIILSSNSLMNIFSTIYPIMLILLMAFSMSNMFYFYILFELVLIPTTILITKLGKQPERLQAGIYLIMYTVTASLPLLACMMSMSNNFSFFFSYIMLYNFKFKFIIILAFLVKMPMFLTHLWLPKAHVEAPLEGSMILAAVLLKLGGYGLIRILPLCIFSMSSMKMWIASISIVGASMTSMNCIRQQDAKALIAYSSVAHMALTLSSIIVLNNMGMMGATMMMIAHGMSSSALFLLVNDLYMKIHSRNIISFKGLISISPNITFWWFIFMAINMSAPPTINTISEIFIMSSLVAWSHYMIIPIMMMSFLTASFCLSLFINISHNKNKMLFFKMSNTKIFLSLISHLLPLIFLLMKMEILQI